MIILRMQELTPAMALQLLKRGMRILTIALITVVQTVIWSRGPHQLRHRFGQHAQVLLAGFELLLRSFLLLDIGAGAKPLDDLALGIFERLCSDQEPAIVSGRAMAQALFCFIGPAGLEGTLPYPQGALLVIRVDGLEPAVPLGLLARHAGIVTPALVTVVSRAIGARHPDQLRDGIDQHTDFLFGSLARGDVDAGDDEILDVVVRIHLGGDRYLKVQEHAFPRANQGLEQDGFARAGSRDGCAQLLLTGRSKGPPGGLGQRLADHLLASEVRAV